MPLGTARGISSLQGPEPFESYRWRPRQWARNTYRFAGNTCRPLRTVLYQGLYPGESVGRRSVRVWFGIFRQIYAPRRLLWNRLCARSAYGKVWSSSRNLQRLFLMHRQWRIRGLFINSVAKMKSPCYCLHLALLLCTLCGGRILIQLNIFSNQSLTFLFLYWVPSLDTVVRQCRWYRTSPWAFLQCYQSLRTMVPSFHMWFEPKVIGTWDSVQCRCSGPRNPVSALRLQRLNETSREKRTAARLLNLHQTLWSVLIHLLLR